MEWGDGMPSAIEEGMTKFEQRIKQASQEFIAETGSVAAALELVQNIVTGFKAESLSESPRAMRQHYRCVLAQLQTDRANGK